MRRDALDPSGFRQGSGEKLRALRRWLDFRGEKNWIIEKIDKKKTRQRTCSLQPFLPCCLLSESEVSV